MSTLVHRALIRHPHGNTRTWRHFASPCRQIGADRLADVRSALRAAEDEAKRGRWVVGFISYDAAPAFDKALAGHRDPRVPLVAFGVFETSLPSSGPDSTGAFDVGRWSASRTKDAYCADLKAIRAHIAAGAVYQVNYTLQLTAPFAGDDEAFFASLYRAQPVDHVAWLDLGRAAMCSASPELFLRRRGDVLETRPMKGTRPRGDDPATDRRLAADLVSSEKDRAENTMIVDMARNDLGRVARVGSVTVPALFSVESYPTVHQLTSTVRAKTRADLAEVLEATFPAASITGAPKVAATHIIADLERRPRGIYTGAVAVLAPGGDFELNVAIRTAWVDRDRGEVSYGVGGGIVWDSDPEAEWREAHDKGRILRRAAPFRLLETMAWTPEQGILLRDLHLNRLARAADHFRFDVDMATIRDCLDAVTAASAQRLRLLVGHDGKVELQKTPLSSPPRLDRPPDGAAVQPVPLDAHPIDPTDEFLRFKTTRRERYDQARARFPDAFDVALWNEAGELTETTRGNLVLDIEGQLITPAVDAGLLPGTLRAHLIEHRAIVPRPVPLEAATRAQRAWMINSVRGWVPIRLVPPQTGHPLARTPVDRPAAS